MGRADKGGVEGQCEREKGGIEGHGVRKKGRVEGHGERRREYRQREGERRHIKAFGKFRERSGPIATRDAAVIFFFCNRAAHVGLILLSMLYVRTDTDI